MKTNNGIVKFEIGATYELSCEGGSSEFFKIIDRTEDYVTSYWCFDICRFYTCIIGNKETFRLGPFKGMPRVYATNKVK